MSLNLNALAVFARTRRGGDRRREALTEATDLRTVMIAGDLNDVASLLHDLEYCVTQVRCNKHTHILF